jgi:hypothetical protein
MASQSSSGTNGSAMAAPPVPKVPSAAIAVPIFEMVPQPRNLVFGADSINWWSVCMML